MPDLECQLNIGQAERLYSLTSREYKLGGQKEPAQTQEGILCLVRRYRPFGCTAVNLQQLG